jgi:hypothetical protein
MNDNRKKAKAIIAIIKGGFFMAIYFLMIWFVISMVSWGVLSQATSKDQDWILNTSLLIIGPIGSLLFLIYKFTGTKSE